MAFSRKLLNNPSVGDIIAVAGRSTKEAKSVDVKLYRDEADTCHVRIQLNFIQKRLQLNSYVDGVWGNEEFAKDPLQLKPGDQFKLYIHLSSNTFNIALEGRPVCDFKMRVDMKTIDRLTVKEDIESVCMMDHRRTCPSLFPSLQKFDPKYSQSFEKPKPVTGGQWMKITGMVTGKEGSFTLMLPRGENLFLALKMEVDFSSQKVVLSSQDDNGEIVNLQLVKGFPFAMNKVFHLLLHFESGHIYISVDHIKMATYNYPSQNAMHTIIGMKTTSVNGCQLEVLEFDEELYVGDGMKSSI